MMVSFFKAVPSNRRLQEAQPISSLYVYTLCVYRPQNTAIYDGREKYNDQNIISDPLLTPMTRSPLPDAIHNPQTRFSPAKRARRDLHSTRRDLHLPKTRYMYVYIHIDTYIYKVLAPNNHRHHGVCLRQSAAK